MQIFALVGGSGRNAVDCPWHHEQTQHGQNEDWEQGAHLLGRRHR